MSTERRVGIREVAAEAGVSHTTVSHILNNYKSLRASEETKRRVREAAERLGYGPNRMARGLRLQRSEMIGLLSEQVATAPHAGRIILGAQDAAREHGFTLVLINTEAGHAPEDAEVLLRQQVDGVLYATMYHHEVILPEPLRGVPLVLIDATEPGASVPSVIPNEKAGAMSAMKELLDHGHTRIGFLNNTDDVPATRDRLAGYKASLRARGLPFDPTLVAARVSETMGGYEAAKALLNADNRPTALFCYNDRMAMGAYRAAAEAHIRIPDDLSVVGFDNQELIAEGLFPPLTTVSLPHYEMGQWAVHRLVSLITDPSKAVTSPVRSKLLPCPLVARESVAAPAATALSTASTREHRPPTQTP